MKKNVLIWIYPDCLHPNGAALTAYPDAPRVFVFDEPNILASEMTLKRIAFIYESLLEIKLIEIRKGNPVQELIEALDEFNCDTIAVVISVDPRFQEIVDELRQHNIQFEIFLVEPFVQLAAGEAEKLNLKRFSKYWNQVKRRALSLNESLF